MTQGIKNMKSYDTRCVQKVLRRLAYPSDIEEIRNLTCNGTLSRFVRAPEFVIHNIKVTPKSVCISKQQIATDYVAIAVPLKKQLNEQIW